MIMKIWLIDDDEDAIRQNTEILLAAFPKASVRSFESIYDALESGTAVDYIVIDVSSVCPLMTSLHGAWAPIASLIDAKPGACVLVTSAISFSSLQDIVELVSQHNPNSLVFPIRWGVGGPVHNVIEFINKHS